jgi:hypothetical protein
MKNIRLLPPAILALAAPLTLPAADASNVLSAADGTVVALAAGLEPDASGTGERLVVTASDWTDLDQSVDGAPWSAAPAHEVIWDEGGVVGAVTWNAVDFDPAQETPFRLRITPPGTVRTLELVNVSGRAGLRHIDGNVITGFVFTGGPKRFLIRAAGPSLVPFGVVGAMLDPALTIHDATGNPIGSADDWDAGSDATAIADATTAVGAFPFAAGSTDAATVVELDPGIYSVVVGSKAGDEGVALAEAYEVPEAGDTGVLRNMSLRARVEGGDRVAIPGFVSTGDSNRRFLIRVVGPGLIPYSVPAPLADPKLTVYRGGVALAANDNWGDSLAADLIEETAAAVGAFSIERSGLDSAVVMALPPGPFTVVVEDASGGSAEGEALIEVYLVPPAL